MAVRRRGGQPQPAPMQGWPPTARPATCASGGQPARGYRSGPGRKGRLPAVRLQGGDRQRPTRKGLPPATNPQGAAVRGQPRRLRRGSGGDDVVRVKEG
ncbi:hypothetical protein GW17_00030315 [Ensete ventricosum]|nr:hypothetical protein GW17_00030315 [Ensete ventricosum]